MERLRVASDVLELEVLPALGARWHRLRAFGQDVLRTPTDLGAHAADPFFWGAYVMAPWCNRLPTGPMEWGGRVIDLPSNFLDGTAIHGQAHGRPWEVVGDAALALDAGGDGWPWGYRVEQELRIDDATLQVALAVENRDSAPMPAGAGMHPWWPRPIRVGIAADRVFADNVAATAEPAEVAGDLDLRQPMPPAVGLDGTWVASAEDPLIELAWPSGLRAEVRDRGGTRFVALAAPPQPDAVAIEPQSHAPDGLRRLVDGQDGALAVLQPGESLHLSFEVRFSGA